MSVNRDDLVQRLESEIRQTLTAEVKVHRETLAAEFKEHRDYIERILKFFGGIGYAILLLGGAILGYLLTQAIGNVRDQVNNFEKQYAALISAANANFESKLHSLVTKYALDATIRAELTKQIPDIVSDPETKKHILFELEKHAGTQNGRADSALAAKGEIEKEVKKYTEDAIRQIDRAKREIDAAVKQALAKSNDTAKIDDLIKAAVRDSASTLSADVQQLKGAARSLERLSDEIRLLQKQAEQSVRRGSTFQLQSGPNPSLCYRIGATNTGTPVYLGECNDGFANVTVR